MRGVACTRHEERSSALLITVQPAAMMRTEAEEGERAAGDLVVQERWRQFESEIERKALKKVVYAPIYNAHWSCSPPSAPFPAPFQLSSRSGRRWYGADKRAIGVPEKRLRLSKRM